jgi:hypothetical protein
MSRGHGAVERWLLANLPAALGPSEGGREQQQQGSPDQLAERFYGAAATEAQRNAIRRALRNLWAQDKVLRWGCWGRGRSTARWWWSLPYTPEQQAAWDDWQAGAEVRYAALRRALGGG